MMVFPSQIASAAEQAGMKVPEDLDAEEFDCEKYPHFAVFCNVQLCRPIQWGEHWENAKIVAAVPEFEIKTITIDQLILRGLQYQEG